MKSALLISLYLVRDTMHRWLMRFSSPLARFLVVFFLSFCGLAFLSSYVLSIEALRCRISRSGADLIVASETLPKNPIHAAGRSLIAPRPQEYTLYTFYEPFHPALVGEHPYPLVEYMPDGVLLFPHTERNGVFVLPEHPRGGGVPENVQIDGHMLQAVSLSAGGLLSKLYPGGAVFIPYGSLPELWRHGYTRKYVVRLHRAAPHLIEHWEKVIMSISRMDHRHMAVVSSQKLLSELAEQETAQYRFRVGVSVGISAILCLLLTAVSSMEFRQNEYVYALLSSFGVSRFLLYLTFVAENAFLVFSGFGTALFALWQSKDYLSHILYRSGELELSLWALEDDIRTFCLAFGLCIPISTLPILAAVCRPIGKILK